MANIRIGRYQNSSGPDLATCEANQQLASFTVGHINEVVTLTSMGAWMGIYSGNPVVRLVLFWEHVDGRPGGVAGYTNEITPSVGYSGGGGGAMYTANLTTPLVVPAGHKLRVGVTSRNGTVGIAMIGAGSINEANESFYRKAISGNIPQDAVGSSVQTNGQLMIYANGTDTDSGGTPPPVPNNKPYPPEDLTPAGTTVDGNLRPTLILRHVDPDGDSATRVHFIVRRQSDNGTMLDRIIATMVSNGSRVAHVYNGIGLEYYVTYELTGRTFDGKDWSDYSTPVTFQINHVNRPPNPPAIVAPSPEMFQKPADVVGFRWIFTDPDASLPGMDDWERTSEVRIIVRNKATGNDVWNSGWIATTRYNGEEVYLSYNGPTLQYLVNYDVIYNHRDRRGSASATLRTMRFEPGGSVEEPTTPKGRITNLSNPGNVVARYNDSDGVAANAVQLDAINEIGQRVKLGNEVPTTVASGATVAVAWAHLGYTLPQGRTIGVRMRARHSITNVWSDWSPPSWLNANAAPAVPLPLSPANGAASSTKPILAVSASDPDQESTALTVTIEVASDPDFQTIVTTNPAIRVSGDAGVGQAGRFEKDHGSTSLVLGTEYWWRAYSYDGYLYSGDTTVAANAARSTPRRFVYATVPSVTITSPATIASPQPTITWTTPAAQSRFRVLLVNDEGTTVYDSGEVAGIEKSHQLQPDGWIDGEQWNNGETFSVTVMVFESLWGTSAPVAVTLSYTYPDTPTSVVVQAITPAGHVGETVIRLDHDPTSYTEGEWAAYRYYRTELSGPGGVAVEGTRIHLLDNTNAAEPWIEDWTVESGKTYIYEASQVITVGVDPLESLSMSGEATAEWTGVVIHLMFQPDMYNIHLRESVPDGAWEPTTRIRHPRARFKRVVGFGRRREEDVSHDFTLRDDPVTGVSGKDQRNNLLSILDCASGYRSPDGAPHTVCWRGGRGGLHSIVYGVFAEETSIVEVGRFRNLWTASIAIEDADLLLGEEVG